MRSSTVMAAVCACLISLLYGAASLANPTSRQLLQGTMTFAKLWREASLPDHRHSPEEVIARYERVIDTSRFLESPFKKWYLGVTHFGLARAYARLEDQDDARKHIQLAIDNNFWNFNVIYADPILRSALGMVYLDSLSEAYRELRLKEQSTWRKQLPIVFGPEEGTIWRKMGNIERWFTDAQLRGHTLDSMYRVRWSEMISSSHSTTKLPVIIALHGGNASYREFASHWSMIGQMTKSYVIALPGLVRYSNTMNGWDTTYDSIDEYLISVIENLRDDDGTLPPIYLAGFSQGACLSLKFGLLHPDIVKGVMSFSGFMDTEITQDLAAHASSGGLRIYAESGEYDSENFKNSLRHMQQTYTAEGGSFVFTESKQMIHELPEPLYSHVSKAWHQLTAN